MGKLVFWIGIIALVWGGARFLSIMQRRNDAASVKRQQIAKEQSESREPVLRCEACGVYVPASEAIRVGPLAYCCKEHSRKL